MFVCLHESENVVKILFETGSWNKWKS